MICPICGIDNKNNKIHTIRERIINKGDTFRYMECAFCGGWSIAEDVDVSEYYPPDYNVYIIEKKKNNLIRILYKKLAFCYVFHTKFISFEKNQKIRGVDHLIKRLTGVRITPKSSILDIGCAKGLWLDDLYECGYKKITGVDLFIPKSLMTDKKWTFLNTDIYGVKGEFDLITLHHSFEHMFEPQKVMEKVFELLKQGGIAVISLPLVGGAAHKEYGDFYCQLDAPRHVVLPTKEGMVKLGTDAGLEFLHVNFDSHALIFSLSRGYMNTDKSHGELISIHPTKEDEMEAKESNKKGNSDQGVFIFQKK